MKDLRQALRGLSTDSLKRGASVVYLGLRVRSVSLMRLLLDIIEPRLQIIIAAATFCLIGMIRPESAWIGMRDATNGEMVDSDH